MTTLLILRRPRQFAAVVLVSLFALIASQARVSPPHAAEAAVPAASLAAAQIAAPPALANAELPPEAPPPYSNFAELDRSPVGAIATAPAARALAPSASPAPALTPIDLSRFVAAAALYRKGATAQADSLAAEIKDPTQRAALEWIALKGSPAPDGARLADFAKSHPDWPASDWIRAVFESSLYSRRASAAEIDAFFARSAPETAAGVLAFARAALAEGRRKDAVEAVAGMWRDWDLDVWTEGAVLREFAGLLSRADHKYRADRLLYAEKAAPALRAASLAGADEVALANARLEAARGPLSARSIAAVPASLQADPGLLFARVQDARRANRTREAAAWLALAPKDPDGLIDPDKWWSERRMVAREYLDQGAYKPAYELCAGAPTDTIAAHVDAAFHAGWIALRFLDDPAAAARNFEEASAVAMTPLAIARANYWKGRAAEALDQTDAARTDYQRAAAYPIAYYGQLAARRLGREGPPLPRTPARVAQGAQRWEAVRIVQLYFEAGLDDFAASLAYSAASVWADEAQLAALGEVLNAHADATVNVAFGKIATERGFALDEAAFPVSGLPAFVPLAHSADRASVFAVARQESEFAWRASSGAGAKGLMQILPSTAQSTARRAGVPFEMQRLINDAGFNLQLGAAYLGQLIDDEGGSFEMALAAYNAGSGRVAQWIQAYGDPRTGAIDPVDWVERIPFDETRDYVQRVSENLAIYRARLGVQTASGGQGARLARE